MTVTFFPEQLYAHRGLQFNNQPDVLELHEQFNAQLVEVPEPGSAMLLIGAAGLGIVRRRQSEAALRD